MRKSTSQIVHEEAAEYLETYGWIQGENGIEGRERCALGALQSGCTRVPESKWDIVRHLLIKKIDETKSYKSLRAIPHWNDKPEQTVENVCKVLRTNI